MKEIRLRVRASSLMLDGVIRKHLVRRIENPCPMALIHHSAELDPQSFNLQYLLATTHLQQGKHSQALSSFSKLLELKPDFIQAHLQKAKILTKDGSFEAAKKEVQEFLKGMKGKGEVDAKLAKDRDDAKDLVSSPMLRPSEELIP